MKKLRKAVQDYVALRRALGFKLERVEAGLLDFVSFLECQWRRKGGPFWRLKRGQRRGCAVDSLASTAG